MAAIWSGQPSDPIARNPKDIKGQGEEDAKVTEVRHARHTPILKAGVPLPLGQSRAAGQYAVGAQSPIELLMSILRTLTLIRPPVPLCVIYLTTAILPGRTRSPCLTSTR